MIRSVTADKESFRPVHFKPGFNVVLADKTSKSTQRDTRNGLGKSTLIEIIHFCLGAGTRKDEGLLVEPLDDWTFTVELRLKSNDIKVSRNTSSPNEIIIEGATDGWPIEPIVNEKTKRKSYNPKDWNTVLGFLMFGLSSVNNAPKYNPTFRSLISYFIRRTSDAYTIPFEHYRKQNDWDVQVNNTYLLGLNWKYASELQVLKDKKKHLDNLKRGLKEGVLSNFLGTIGELEAEQVQIKTELDESQEGLETFNVLPQYRQLETQSNRQTRQIQKLRNEKIKLLRRLSYYEASFEEEASVGADAVTDMYEKAGVEFPEMVLKRLDDVQAFYSKVVTNRKAFLENEMGLIKQEIEEISSDIRSTTAERASLMATLKTHGPWDEYQKLSEVQSDKRAELKTLNDRIETLREIQEGTSTYKIERETLLKRVRQDYEEREVQRGVAISSFNNNSQKLYNAPGKLVVDIVDGGYKFNVDIQRSGSRGIDSMKVFCYDWVLSKIWSEKQHSPCSLIHDSIIFDGVDERQRALALQLAASHASDLDFQYICTLNSDMIPHDEFDEDFNFDEYVRITLTDDKPEGGLLGIRF